MSTDEVQSGSRPLRVSKAALSSNQQLADDDVEVSSNEDNDLREEDHDAEFKAKIHKQKGKSAAASTNKKPRKRKSDPTSGTDKNTLNRTGRLNSEGDALANGEYAIASDNNLFEAVRNPATALELSVEEWIDTYLKPDETDSEDHRGTPMAELLNFVLRVKRPTLSYFISLGT